MIFKVLRLRKTVREVREDTGGFVADEVGGVLTGLMLIPVIIVCCALALFFILGFTTLLGGPMGFFKVLFIIGICMTILVFAVVYPIVRFIRRSARRVTNRAIHSVKNECDK